MKLFRRLFTRAIEEVPESVTPDTPSKSEEQDVDEIDPTTRPLGPPEGVAISDALPVSVEGATRQLPAESLMARKTEHIAFGQVSDVGLVRTNNQDSAYSFFVTSHSVDEQPDFGLFIVADGMGGHLEGEKASAITTRVLAAEVTNGIYLPMLSVDNNADRPPLTEMLVSAIQKANKEIQERVPDGGTTVTAVIIIGDLAHVAHVGDSRAYLITQEGVEQITRDHSLVQRLIELDQLTPEEAANHPQKNVLYRALGQADTVEVDTLTRRLQGNSRLLVCSDGLWGLVEERDLFEISMNNPNPQEACEKLVALANAQGGIDNITAILLNIS